MSETESSLPGAETAAESTSEAPPAPASPAEADLAVRPELDKAAPDDNNSVRAILEREYTKLADQPLTADDSGATSPTAAAEQAGPPTSWTEAERNIWQSLPPAARDTITRREREYEAGLRTDREVRKVLEPLAAHLEGSGQHVNQYLESVLQDYQYIGENPVEAAIQILQRSGKLDEARRILSENPAPSAAPDDRIAELEKRLAERDQRDQYSQAVQHHKAAWNELVAAHPDAAELNTFIAGELTANPSLSFKDAYDAVKSKLGGHAPDPAEVEQRDITAAVERAQKAKRLDLPRGDSGAPEPSSANDGTIRGAMEQAWRELTR